MHESIVHEVSSLAGVNELEVSARSLHFSSKTRDPKYSLKDPPTSLEFLG